MRDKRDIWKMTERLERASMGELDSQIKKDPDLREFLFKPIKNLGQKYSRYFDVEFFEIYKDKTFYDFIRDQLTSRTNHGVFLYSRANDSLEGFASYTISPDHAMVLTIGVFSFHPNNPSFVLARDMKTLIAELYEKFTLINFQCEEDQPLLKAYKRICQEYNGVMEEIEGGYNFSIFGKRYYRAREAFKKKNYISEKEMLRIEEKVKESFKAPTFEEIEEGLRKRSERY